MKLTLSLPIFGHPLWWSDALLTIVLSTAAFVLLCRNFLGEADRLFMAG